MTKLHLKFIAELSQHIDRSRYTAAKLANREQLLLYYKTGKMLSEKMDKHKWNGKVIQRIPGDLQTQSPGLRGFAYRKLMNMVEFYVFYKEWPILRTVSAELTGRRRPSQGEGKATSYPLEGFFGLSFYHHICLINKCHSQEERDFYLQEASCQCWPLSFLSLRINDGYFQKRQGHLPNNSGCSPRSLIPNAIQVFMNESFTDFIGTNGPTGEYVLEAETAVNIRDLILRRGKGFSFIGSQFRIEVDKEDFFVDLLFYNRHLQCLVAFVLKQSSFNLTYALELKLSRLTVDLSCRLPHENPSIGIMLCKEKGKVIIAYSVTGSVNANNKTCRVVPEEMKGILPDEEEFRGLL